MTTVHAELIGDKVILSRVELDQLMELARQHNEVELLTTESEIPTCGITLLAEQGHAFDFLAADDNLYTVEDLKIRYR